MCHPAQYWILKTSLASSSFGVTPPPSTHSTVDVICVGSLVVVGRVVWGEVGGVEEEGGLGHVDGEGDEVAEQADDVALVPQIGDEPLRGLLLFNAVSLLSPEAANSAPDQ